MVRTICVPNELMFPLSMHSLLFAFIYVYGCTQNIVKMLRAVTKRVLKRFCGNTAILQANKAKNMVQEKCITIKFCTLYRKWHDTR